MAVISMREYAKRKNISYEAVRKQVARYREELGDHITMDGRQQFLDDEAVEFLDAKRQKNPVVIIQQGKDEQIEQLTKERDLLLAKVAAQGDQIAGLMQFKLDTIEQRQLIEDTKAQQARREKELDQKEKTFAQEIENARNQAMDEVQQEFEAVAKQAIDEVRQEAEKNLVSAHAAFEKELKVRDSKFQAMADYAAALESYNSLNWWKRRKAEKPVKPVFEEE